MSVSTIGLVRHEVVGFGRFGEGGGLDRIIHAAALLRWVHDVRVQATLVGPLVDAALRDALVIRSLGLRLPPLVIDHDLGAAAIASRQARPEHRRVVVCCDGDAEVRRAAARAVAATGAQLVVTAVADQAGGAPAIVGTRSLPTVALLTEAIALALERPRLQVLSA